LDPGPCDTIRRRKVSTMRRSNSLRIRPLCAILACGLSLGSDAGCRRPDGSKKSGADKGQRLVPDTLFKGTKPVTVWEIPCRHELVFDGAEISGHEPPGAALQRKRWVRRSALLSRLLVHPKRLVWVLPTRATPRGTAEPLHLVLQPRSNIVAMVSHGRKRYWADTPDQVAAWIEGALRPVSPIDRLELLAQRVEGARVDPGESRVRPPTHVIRGLLVLSNRGSGRRRKGLRYELESRALASSALDGPGQGQPLIWDLALLPFLKATGAKSLAPLRGKQHWPLRIRLRVAHTTPRNLPAPWLQLSLDLSARKRRSVSPKLLRLPPEPGYRRMFGPLTYKEGRQLFRQPKAKQFKRQKGDPRKGSLRVRNPRGRVALVYADGVLLGLVGPRSRFAFGTTEPGYFRVTTHSLFGTDVWGPQDLYVPGNVTLEHRTD